MYQQQPQGWVEVLFSLSKDCPAPVNMSDIKEADYMLLGSPIPIQEVDGPYDIYQMLQEGIYPGMPRAVRSFDLINVVQRGLPIITYVVISPTGDEAFLRGLHTTLKVKNKVMIWAQFSHGILEMHSSFGSFCGRHSK